MGQPPRPIWDERDQEIAELEAELDLAYQIIDQLEWEKYELQKHVHYLQSALSRNKASSLHSKNPRQKQRQESDGSPTRTAKRRIIKRSKPNLVVLAFALILGFATIGLVAGLAVKNILLDTRKPYVKPPTEGLTEPY